MTDGLMKGNHEWVSEWASEGVREWVSEWVSEWVRVSEGCMSLMCDSMDVSGEGGGGREEEEEGADTELKTKTPHVNVGKKHMLFFSLQ